MPIHTYQCPNGHQTEILYRTFAESAVKPPTVPCNKCAEISQVMEWELPLQAHLYGTGWYKPSPTQRHSYKHVNREGNPGNFGYESPLKK